MNDERTNLGQQVARDVREFFKEKVYRHGHPAQRAPRRSAQPRHAGRSPTMRAPAAPKPIRAFAREFTTNGKQAV